MRGAMRGVLTVAAAIATLSGPVWAQDATPNGAAPAKPSLNLDTPIAVIAADQRGRAVLDKNLPGLTTHPMYEAFKNESLRQFQPKTGGAVTKDSLVVTEKDLAALDMPQGR